MTERLDTTNPVEALAALIRCPSVTPDEGGALATLEAMLEPLGFAVERVTFREPGTPDVENLYARLGTASPHIMFAGHTDVVPVGDARSWTHGPFDAAIVNGEMVGRGAVDMKGGIACFVAACARNVARHGAPSGSISFLITGDEEGPSINGTAKLLEWAAGKGERWDGCVVGEPTNPAALGDMIKIGRRGSLSATLVVNGVQGHVAYPHLADNPVHSILSLCQALLAPAFDEGTDNFPPTNLEVTSIDVGNAATNVIPARATAAFNVRFNDVWEAETLQTEIHNRLDRAAEDLRAGSSASPVDFEVQWRERPSHVFLTRDENLIATMQDAVTAVTGSKAALSTTGGTSDARFIKDYCPVVEFGLVGKTMHMVDERVALADLETLTTIYSDFLDRWFGG
ncbi:succinyl-diaminopimelate desuccinylase [Pararhizobium haloflavum]|uniref:succinyl-diaminopimelate desuccinylase n=1 Tax=Pararhizobium haloflavum TaxID=2037914 RepID=UPI000C1853F0|nr:succinyl-diaminopimelate desuccinylase [Pararhizobium haloflavum]